jgi:hypothetical protein
MDIANGYYRDRILKVPLHMQAHPYKLPPLNFRISQNFFQTN